MDEYLKRKMEQVKTNINNTVTIAAIRFTSFSS